MSLLRSAALKGFAVAVCAISGLAASAQAADELSLNDRAGFYASAKGGYASVDTDDVEIGALDLTPESAYMIAGGVGYNLGAFRVEGEVVYFWGSEDDSAFGFDADLDYSVLAPMVNGYFDFPLADRLSGYVGAGVGWGFAEVEAEINPGSFEEDDDDDALALQFMLGLGYQVAERVTLTGGYRGFWSDTNESFWAHTIELGVRFDF